MTQASASLDTDFGGSSPQATICAEWLFDRYYDRICSLASSLLGNEEDAVETTLDVLSTAAASVLEVGTRSPVFLALYRDCIRACLDRNGFAGRESTEDSDDDFPAFSNEGRHSLPVADWTAEADRLPFPLVRDAIRRFIGELPHPWRIAVILVDVQGLTVEEVGRILDLPARTVIGRLHRGRLSLRGKLSDYSLATRRAIA
jgi:RNA polymerase sigma-70 factor (ECF subfamily)